MKTMLVSEFKAKRIAVLKEVQKSSEPVVVTLRGRPLARVEGVEDTTSHERLGTLQGALEARRDIVRTDTSGA